MSFFLIAVEGAGTDSDTRRPKYIPALGVAWAMTDLGESALVWAATSPAQETSVDANADAFLVPPLNNAVAVSATQTAMESFAIPAQWVVTGMNYRTVMRVVWGMAQLVQRTDGLLNKLIVAGNLNLTMSQIPAGKLATLQDASDSLGLNRSAITGSTTVREALRILGQQMANRRIVLGNL